MTIDFGFDVANDPPPRHVNDTVSDDGYMAVGGQCIYVGLTAPKPLQQPIEVESSSTRKPNADDDWIFFDTYCVYIGDK